MPKGTLETLALQAFRAGIDDFSEKCHYIERIIKRPMTKEEQQYVWDFVNG